jgi:hypothetical protein
MMEFAQIFTLTGIAVVSCGLIAASVFALTAYTTIHTLAVQVRQHRRR